VGRAAPHALGSRVSRLDRDGLVILRILAEVQVKSYQCSYFVPFAVFYVISNAVSSSPCVSPRYRTN
jgi:hypothetical protein